MGSVFVYHVSTLRLQKVRALLEHGIGERRAEGFGRLAINWQIHHKLECNETALDEPAPGITLSPEAGAATTLATRMVARLLRQKLDRRVIELANDVSANEGESTVMKPAPRKAQLSRLRSVIADALMQSPPALSLVADYLNDIAQRATARKQYEHARLQGQNLLEWLKTVLTRVDEQAWTAFFRLRSDDLRGIGGITPALADSLRREYLLRYVDAVLVRATKQNRQEE
jgi:CRISPR-associated protein Csx10